MAAPRLRSPCPAVAGAPCATSSLGSRNHVVRRRSVLGRPLRALCLASEVHGAVPEPRQKGWFNISCVLRSRSRIGRFWGQLSSHWAQSRQSSMVAVNRAYCLLPWGHS